MKTWATGRGTLPGDATKQCVASSRRAIVVAQEVTTRTAAMEALGAPPLSVVTMSSLEEVVEMQPGVGSEERSDSSSPTRTVLIVGRALTSEVRFLESLRAVRRCAPHLGIVLAVSSREFMGRIVEYAIAGCDEVVHLGDEGSFSHLRVAVETRLARGLPKRPVAKLSRADQFAIASWVIRNSFRDLSLAHVAGWFSCDPSTVARRLAREGGHTFEQLRRWGRLLHCAKALDAGASRGAIARSLSFGSAAHFSTFVARYAGLPPSRLRHLGAMNVVEELLGAIATE